MPFCLPLHPRTQLCVLEADDAFVRMDQAEADVFWIQGCWCLVNNSDDNISIVVLISECRHMVGLSAFRVASRTRTHITTIFTGVTPTLCCSGIGRPSNSSKSLERCGAKHERSRTTRSLPSHRMIPATFTHAPQCKVYPTMTKDGAKLNIF